MIILANFAPVYHRSGLNITLLGQSSGRSELLCCICRMIPVHTLSQHNNVQLSCTMQASNITSLVSIDGQVAVLRKAHAMLSAHLELDTWAQTWAEADGQQAFDAFSGRMAHCITVQVLTDLLPNFGYCEPTQRFTRLVGSPWYLYSNTSCTWTVKPAYYPPTDCAYCMLAQNGNWPSSCGVAHACQEAWLTFVLLMHATYAKHKQAAKCGLYRGIPK